MIGAAFSTGDAMAFSEEVRSGRMTALEVITICLLRIERFDSKLKCFTTVLADSARAQAAEIDRRIAAGEDPGPLAGVPFAVKNLFDVAGITTIAGSKIHAENPPATRDAAAVERLKKAGAVIMGALNMDEYAY